VRDPARTDSAARRRYIHYLQRSLSCVSSVVVRPSQPDRRTDAWLLVTTSDPVEIATADGPKLRLTFEQAFHHGPHPRFPGERKVFTDMYSYRVRYSEKPEDALFAWHWHPLIRPESHLHIGAPHKTATDLHKKHVPAGRVSFEEVLLFLIHEMDAVPAKESYREDLGDSLARFDEFKSWSGSRRPPEPN
jgi:hypothetical protein